MAVPGLAASRSISFFHRGKRGVKTATLALWFESSRTSKNVDGQLVQPLVGQLLFQNRVFVEHMGK